jgi:hypothetical protein
MNNSKKEELRPILMKMATITNFVHECNLYSHALHFPNNMNDQSNNVFIESPDIDFFKYLLRNTIILELNKLFSYSEKDKFAIPKLIKRFASGADLSDIKLFEFCNSLFTTFEEDNRSLLEDFKTLRDKVIAHSDYRDLKTNNSIWDFLTKFNSLICFSADFSRQVHKRVFNEDMQFKFESIFYQKTDFELLTIYKKHKRGDIH